MSEVRKDIRFKNPHLTNLNFGINENFDIEKFEGFGKLKLKVKKSFKEDYNKEDLEGSSLVSLEVKIGESKEVYPFYAEISVEAIFEWDNFNSEQVEQFLNVNAAAVLYSYCRTHISYVTAASGLPSYSLPFYNFTDESIE